MSVPQEQDEAERITSEWTDTIAPRRTVRRLKVLIAAVLREKNNRIRDLLQTSANLCTRCGWRFDVPGHGCMKCDGFDQAKGAATISGAFSGDT